MLFVKIFPSYLDPNVVNNNGKMIVQDNVDQHGNSGLLYIYITFIIWYTTPSSRVIYCTKYNGQGGGEMVP